MTRVRRRLLHRSTRTRSRTLKAAAAAATTAATKAALAAALAAAMAAAAVAAAAVEEEAEVRVAAGVVAGAAARVGDGRTFAAAARPARASSRHRSRRCMCRWQESTRLMWVNHSSARGTIRKEGQKMFG